MRITTDSGTSLEVEPPSKPLPASTPEVQTIPAAGFTPAQVVTLIEQAKANPPVTPNPAVLPPISQPPPAPKPQPPAAPAGGTPLKGAQAVDELYAQADLNGIDALAAAANALHEGAGGGIGDGGTAFGPWQEHLLDGRIPGFVGKPLYSPEVQAWAWSAEGFGHAFRGMVAGGARGLKGLAAVHAIVYGFELPKDEACADQVRQAEYRHLVSLGGQVRAYLIGAFGGPAFGASVAGTPVNVPEASPTAPVTAANAFRRLLDAASGDLARSAQFALTTSGRFLSAVS